MIDLFGIKRRRLEQEAERELIIRSMRAADKAAQKCATLWLEVAIGNMNHENAVKLAAKCKAMSKRLNAWKPRKGRRHVTR